MDYQVCDALQRIAFALEYAHRIEGTPGGARSREPQPRPPPTPAPGPYRTPAGPPHEWSSTIRGIGCCVHCREMWAPAVDGAPCPKRPDPVVRRLDDQLFAAIRTFWETLGIAEPDNEALQNVLDAHAARLAHGVRT